MATMQPDPRKGYAGHIHMPLMLINGDIPPDNFRYGFTEDTEQLVKSTRNSKGEVVAKKVGKRLLKFNNLEWPIMVLSDYLWLQNAVEKFYAKVTYFDARAGYSEGSKYNTGGIVTKEFYWGDFSAEPFEFVRNTTNGLLVPLWYKNVKVNLIDCGRGYLPSPPLPKPPYAGAYWGPDDYNRNQG